ncbi:MAG: trigger factor [Lachnospiraceae bacterium]|nr:trigger factor [Lachnospiraceae bacterium]
MKRKTAIILIAAMMTGLLAGCTNEDSKQENTTSETAEAAFNVNEIDAQQYVTKLGEYKGLAISASKQEVTDDDVENAIQYMLTNSQETVEVTGRAVQEGDVVNIDFEGKKDGVAFDGGTAQGYDLTIGSGQFIDGFEDGLVGLNVGDTVDLDLTFPENYQNSDLAGAPVVFTVTINKISELKTPELNDEFVKGLGIEGCTTVDEFRKETRNRLEKSAQDTYHSSLQTAAMDALMPNCEVKEDVPAELLDYYRNMITTNIDNNAASYGMSTTDFVSLYYGMDETQYNEQIETSAKESVNQALICMMIAQKENLTVDDQELDKAIEENYASFGYTSAEEYKENGTPEDYRNYLMTVKVLDFLVENATVTEQATE